MTRFVSGVTGLKGMKAVKTLLTGTRRVSSNGFWYREFEKPGGIRELVEDFKSVRPTNVRDFQMGDGVCG